jgi:hypothetical protein
MVRIPTPTATQARKSALDREGYHYISYGGKDRKERALTEAKKRIRLGYKVTVLSCPSPGMRERLTYDVYYKKR